MFISTEVHKGFKPLFAPGLTEAEKTKAAETIAKRLGLLAGEMQGDYLFGRNVSVADAYLFVMLTWARNNNIEIPRPLPAYAERMNARPAVLPCW